MIRDYNENIFHIRNASGQVIHCVYTYRDPEAPLMVIAPPYEGSVRSCLMPMLFLINNGFNVLRFDFTEHIGNSDGEFIDFTMTSALEDLAAVLKVVRTDPRFESAPAVGVLAISISSRLVYRHLAEHPESADLFLSLFGVVDLGRTIIAANEEENLDAYKLAADPSVRYGTVRVIRYRVDVDTYMQDLVANDLHSLEGTKADVARMKTPTILVLSKGDTWVLFEDCEEVFGSRSDLIVDAYQLPNAGHELYKNPEAAKEAFRGATHALRRHYDLPEIDLTEPVMSEIVQLNSKERERETKYEDSALRVVD